MKSFKAEIFLGFREKYSSKVRTIEECKNFCQIYVNRVSWCVTVTETEFIYKDGREPGAIIGIIQYPRFPTDESELKRKTIDIAELLKEQFHQERVSINFPDEVIMLESLTENN